MLGHILTNVPQKVMLMGSFNSGISENKTVYYTRLSLKSKKSNAKHNPIIKALLSKKLLISLQELNILNRYTFNCVNKVCTDFKDQFSKTLTNQFIILSRGVPRNVSNGYDNAIMPFQETGFSHSLFLQKKFTKAVSHDPKQAGAQLRGVRQVRTHPP